MKKTVKAWIAVLRKDGKCGYFGGVYAVDVTKSIDTDHICVPCTITYTVPRGSKEKTA